MNTRQLRVNYNNTWPEKFEFPIEKEFLALLEDNGIKQALTADSTLKCNTHPIRQHSAVHQRQLLAV